MPQILKIALVFIFLFFIFTFLPIRSVNAACEPKECDNTGLLADPPPPGYTCERFCLIPRPTATQAPNPTKEPTLPPGTTPTSTPTPTDAPDATPDPSCIAEPQKWGPWGSCSTASECPNAKSAASCEGGQCYYSAPLKNCEPCAGGSKNWVPDDWGCTGQGNVITDFDIRVNPDGQSDNDRYDVLIDNVKKFEGHKPTKFGQECRSRVSIFIGPDSNSLRHSSPYHCGWQTTSNPYCRSDGLNNNIGARNENGWEYKGGSLCAKAHLFWQTLDNGDCGMPNDEAERIECIGQNCAPIDHIFAPSTAENAYEPGASFSLSFYSTYAFTEIALTSSDGKTACSKKNPFVTSSGGNYYWNYLCTAATATGSHNLVLDNGQSCPKTATYTTLDPLAPAKNVSAACNSPDGPVTINWTDSANNNFYKIDRRLNSGAWIAPWTTLGNANATGAQDYSVVYNNSYSYLVNACRGDQYGAHYCQPPANTATVSCPTPTRVHTPTPTNTPTPTCAPPNTPALSTSLSSRQSTAAACGQPSVTCTNDNTPTWNWTNTSPTGRCAVSATDIYRSYQLGWTDWIPGITTTYSTATLADDTCFNATARYQNINQQSAYPNPLWIKVDTQAPETPNLTLTCNNSTGNITASWTGLNSDNGCAGLSASPYWVQISTAATNDCQTGQFC